MSRGRRLSWMLSACIAVLTLMAGLVLVLAPALGLNRALGMAAILPVRNALTLTSTALAIVGIVLAFWRPVRPVALPLATTFIVLSAVSIPTVVTRGFQNQPPVSAATGQLRVLEWNTNGDLVSPTTIAALAVREHANVIVLPDAEIGAHESAYRRAFATRGLPVTVYRTQAHDAQVAVLLARPLADEYRVAGTGPDARKTLVVQPTAAHLPRIVAVHAPQPTRRNTAAWDATLRWTAHECAHGAALAVGDFNASIDDFGSASLGDCVDAAVTRRSGSVGTWPTGLPVIAAMPIDHLLASRSVGRVESFTVLTNEDHSGARHRPTLTVVHVPETAG